ncbi:MAG TPA: spore germination protein GerW family protein [Pyrinomonadaceae bacterium]|nr:spore germination protein GerW family protein [Pyrinomonadaceae bacterium]
MSDSQNKMQSIETSFIERLAQKIGVTANAKYIYGEPVERGSVTVITVAKAVYGFGGGSGKNDADEGSGGGGGAVLAPVGYIEIKNGKTRFHPTRDWLNLIPMLAATLPVIFLTTWGITRLLGLKESGRKVDGRLKDAAR